ncbi:hypothetical protein S83_035107, partial [Arachis hypogaea]
HLQAPPVTEEDLVQKLLPFKHEVEKGSTFALGLLAVKVEKKIDLFHLGLAGLFVGLLIGVVSCFILLLTFIARINWMNEAAKAQTLVCVQVQDVPRHD